MTTPDYHIDDTSKLLSPSMIVFREQLERNLDGIIEIAGSADRLRPHCKTHKMAEVTKIELARGITKHKAATFAEAEMLADAGVKDILLAYSLVGPNLPRAVAFRQKYPDVTFIVTADDFENLKRLSETMVDAGTDINVLLDVDCGQHRTGVVSSEQAMERYRQIDELPGLIAAGFHVYDGHQHQVAYEDRKAAVREEFEKVLAMRDEIESRDGLKVPRLVCGGTGSFPVYAEYVDPTIELSPGTIVFGDASYTENFPDLKFPAAAVLLTRVISKPEGNRITLDLGYKAVASDPPAGKRAFFPELPDAKQVLQNEEHLVLETDRADDYQVGDELIAIPWHVCPTTALHAWVYVVENGNVTGEWEVTSRNRKITI
ncbi:MAG: D-TA family PLP-dependent enzyme [Planctomycetaceae bacterium]|nr:D-TA family PLP-dependent enzyme [Planctomycetaceae bacterium]